MVCLLCFTTLFLTKLHAFQGHSWDKQKNFFFFSLTEMNFGKISGKWSHMVMKMCGKHHINNEELKYYHLPTFRPTQGKSPGEKFEAKNSRQSEKFEVKNSRRSEKFEAKQKIRDENSRRIGIFYPERHFLTLKWHFYVFNLPRAKFSRIGSAFSPDLKDIFRGHGFSILLLLLIY